MPVCGECGLVDIWESSCSFAATAADLNHFLWDEPLHAVMFAELVPHDHWLDDEIIVRSSVKKIDTPILFTSGRSKSRWYVPSCATMWISFARVTSFVPLATTTSTLGNQRGKSEFSNLYEFYIFICSFCLEENSRFMLLFVSVGNLG